MPLQLRVCGKKKVSKIGTGYIFFPPELIAVNCFGDGGAPEINEQPVRYIKKRKKQQNKTAS